MRRLIIIFLILFSLISQATGAEKLKIAVTHPWLLAGFIGGAEVEIIQIREWNLDGELIRTPEYKNLHVLPPHTRVIAIDENEAKSTGLDLQDNNFEIRLLYKPFPVSLEKISDPSVMPFLAQRILTALSEWDASNYPFYQRRLAEFQARLSSSLLAGQILRGSLICDLSGVSGILLQAAGCKITRPSNEILEQMQAGKNQILKDYIDDVRAKGYLIFIDAWTHKNIKRFLAKRTDVYSWSLPTVEMDYPSFLHEQYIALWQKTIAKPLPQKRR